jgi:hypothetical protein
MTTGALTLPTLAIKMSFSFTRKSSRTPSPSVLPAMLIFVAVLLPPENTAPAGIKGGSEVRLPVDIFPTENVHPSTVPNNSGNPSGTSSKEFDEPDRPNVIPFDLDNDQEDTNLTNQDDVTSSLDASAELMR